ncbi:hypothetical protein BHE74_00012530 [Ensete ventricosum]|nr:hypothetical protein BHE74_00012530 [Ensete ventricosum]
MNRYMNCPLPSNSLDIASYRTIQGLFWAITVVAGGLLDIAPYRTIRGSWLRPGCGEGRRSFEGEARRRRGCSKKRENPGGNGEVVARATKGGLLHRLICDFTASSSHSSPKVDVCGLRRLSRLLHRMLQMKQQGEEEETCRGNVRLLF